MFRIRSAVLVLVIAAAAGCASSAVTRRGAGSETSQGLVGAWAVTASRPAGVGKNLLTFSSDGTFFRSGDTHPVLSGAHGAWKQVVIVNLTPPISPFDSMKTENGSEAPRPGYVLLLGLETMSSLAWPK